MYAKASLSREYQSSSLTYKSTAFVLSLFLYCSVARRRLIVRIQSTLDMLGEIVWSAEGFFAVWTLFELAELLGWSFDHMFVVTAALFE